MPPVPKKKQTRSRSGIRRGAYKLSLPTLTKCSSCGKLKRSHTACPHCGDYGKAGHSK